LQEPQKIRKVKVLKQGRPLPKRRKVVKTESQLVKIKKLPKKSPAVPVIRKKGGKIAASRQTETSEKKVLSRFWEDVAKKYGL
jgi:hypothetical protein